MTATTDMKELPMRLCFCNKFYLVVLNQNSYICWLLWFWILTGRAKILYVFLDKKWQLKKIIHAHIGALISIIDNKWNLKWQLRGIIFAVCCRNCLRWMPWALVEFVIDGFIQGKFCIQWPLKYRGHFEHGIALNAAFLSLV